MKLCAHLFLLVFTLIVTGHAMAAEERRAACIDLLNSKALEIEKEFNAIDTRGQLLIEKKFAPANFKDNEEKAALAQSKFNDYFEENLKKKLRSVKDTPEFYRGLADRTASDESYYPRACTNPEKLENNYNSDIRNYKKVWVLILLVADQYVSSNQ